MTIFAWCVYIGGVPKAYVKSRKYNGRVESFFDAITWPLGLGRHLARVYWEE